MTRPNGLASAAVRFRPASFAGTFVALMMSALIVTACGILLENGVRASVPAVRYADAPVVAAADQYEYVVTGSGEGREEEAVPLPDTARVDAGLAARAADAPGEAAAVPDFTFPVRAADAGTGSGSGGAGSGVRELPVAEQAFTALGWGPHVFTGTAPTAGSAPRTGEVVLDAGTARAAKAAAGDTVTLDTAAGPHDFRVAGVAEAGPAKGARGTGTGAELAKVQDLDVREGSLDRLGEGRVAIDRTLADSADVGVGDRLPPHLPDGTKSAPEVVAVYGRGLGLATVTLDRASLAGHVSSGFDSTLLVRAARPARRRTCHRCSTARSWPPPVDWPWSRSCCRPGRRCGGGHRADRGAGRSRPRPQPMLAATSLRSCGSLSCSTPGQRVSPKSLCP
ncbi:hypothetical protein ACIOML_09175 [Streptomyces anulatus]